MISDEFQKLLEDFKSETTHKVTFFSKNQQYWFKNSTTGREYPLPIALIEGITKSETNPEANRAARQDFKRYIEKSNSAKH